MLDVLLVVDNSFRELSGFYIIKYYLEKLGYKIGFSSRFSIHFALLRQRPKMVILSSATYPYIPEISKFCFVCVLPSESGNGQKSQILGTHKGTNLNKLHTSFVDLFFSWGEQMSEWLIESGAYTKDQIVTTGNPSTDHWLIKRETNRGNRVGLTTTLRSFANSMDLGSGRFIEYIYKTEMNGGDGNFFEPPNHIEAWLHWEISFLRVVCDIVRDVIIPTRMPMEIRPHPFENAEKYSYLTEKSNGFVSVNKEGSITDWFSKIGVLLTYMSGSAIDASVYGIPVISLRKILNKEALERVPQGFIYDYYQYFWEPDNLNDLRELSRKGLEGKLDLSSNKKRLSEYIQNHFHYPRKFPSGKLIADAIHLFFQKNKARNNKNFKKTFSYLGGTFDQLFKLPLTEELSLLIKYLLIKFPQKEIPTGFNYTFQPWNLKLRHKAKTNLQKILKSIE